MPNQIRQDGTSFSLNVRVNVISSANLAVPEPERGQAELERYCRAIEITAFLGRCQNLIKGLPDDCGQVLVQHDPLVMLPHQALRFFKRLAKSAGDLVVKVQECRRELRDDDVFIIPRIVYDCSIADSRKIIV